MIKHHPSIELLKSYVEGTLTASLSAGITIHIEMCSECRDIVAQLTEQRAEHSFEEFSLNVPDFAVDDIEEYSSLSFDEMITNITKSDELVESNLNIEKVIEIKGNKFKLPSVLNNINIGKASHIGKLTRARLDLNEGEIHSSLLHIDPGGSVPEHTHKGFELTVLLAGSFKDENGVYVKGDFIFLDQQHHHHPISERGCLCYTVANDALHFTQGLNKLLNPIGSFIY
jgi:putative transcriptional regulator